MSTGALSNGRFADRYAELPPLDRTMRDRFRGRLRRVALAYRGLTAKPPRPPWLRCLYCHYVYDDQVERFRHLLRGLSQMGRFITTAEVIEVASGRRAPDGACFHLSFDDGFNNVYKNAWPVLRELNIPALFFVVTGVVGASDSGLANRRWSPTLDHMPARPIRWDALREMADGGVDIGSHTRTHARLSEISSDPARLADEVAGSKADLEARLGRPCRYFSWPFGTMRDIDDRSFEAIRAAGYTAAFSAVRGQVQAPQTSLYAIPRHHFEPQDPWTHVRYFACGGRERES